MRALTSVPGQSVPVLVDAETPTPATGEVLIQVQASAVNPVDVLVASGAARAAFRLSGELGLGWDVAGRVVSVGEGVDGFAAGDLVAGLHDQLAAPLRAHAEFVVLPSSSVARIPAGLSVVDAATVPLNALTAAQALALAGPAQGRTLLITGAGGAVGGFAVALAAAGGWRVIGLGRSRDEEFARSAGASEVRESLAANIADVVLDTASLGEPALAAVTDGGVYVGVRPGAGPQTDRPVRVTAVGVRADGAQLAGLLERVADGDLAARVAGTAGLDQAASVYGKVAAGGLRGRWVLQP